MGQTLLEKVWDLHTVRRLPNGQTQLFIGLHLIHEVTTPQAFDMLRQRGIGVAFPERTYATVDHACGDSHTSTHGAFGAIAFGIGTSQVRDVLASQCLAIDPLKVRRIVIDGVLGEGVYAKDVILEIIARLGVKGGVGYAYEYAGAVVDQMSMDERMTMCNMSIEGGARIGYVNPDETTFDYLAGRPFIP